MTVPSLSEIKDIFKAIDASKSAKHLLNDKMSLEQRTCFYVMEEFFHIIAPERLDGIVQISYKNSDGYDFYVNSLRKLTLSILSSQSKKEIGILFEDIYNCFKFLFPENIFKWELEEAKRVVDRKNIVVKQPSMIRDNNGGRAQLLVDILKGLENDDELGQLATILLRVKNNQKSLTEALDEVSYVSQKAKDVEQKLQKAEESFDSQSKLLFDELKSKNDIYRKDLEEKLSTDFNDLNTRINKDKEFYEVTIGDFDTRIKDLDTRFDALEIGTYREELARYFLREHDKLKGKIDSLAALYFIFLNAGVAVFTYLVTSLGCKLDTVDAVISGFVAMIFCSFAILHWERKKINARVFKSMGGLLTPYWCWLFLTFVGMSSILYKAISVSEKINTDKVANSSIWGLMLPHVGVYILLVWFTWFSAKQFSYTKQIADEYEYKYALAKAYMSYKDEALSVVIEHGNNPYLVALLDSVIKNIASSPVQCVKQDVHTPFSEVFKVVKDTLEKKNPND